MGKHWKCRWCGILNTKTESCCKGCNQEMLDFSKGESHAVSWKIALQKLSGDRLHIEIDCTCTVLMLKEAVQEAEGHPIPCIKLVLNGIPLDEDTKELKNYGVNDGSILVLVLSEHECQMDLQSDFLCLKPQARSIVHVMLTHLKDWWTKLDGLLQHMADENLLCEGEEEEAQQRRDPLRRCRRWRRRLVTKTLTTLSDRMDTVLDYAIQQLGARHDSNALSLPADASIFPISDIENIVRDIKDAINRGYRTFSKGGKQNAYVRMAEQALSTLESFYSSATDLYHELCHPLCLQRVRFLHRE